MMETHIYSEFPTHLSVVHIALFTQVTNSSLIRERILGAAVSELASDREAVNFAFVNANLITSTLHLKTAIYQAIISASQGSLRTKTVHSEILWALNPTNNITEAIKRYGVQANSTALFVVRISGPDLTGIQEKMKAVVQGHIVPLDDMNEFTDWSLTKKYYKLNNEPVIQRAAGNISREHAVIDNIVTSSVAMKSVMS